MKKIKLHNRSSKTQKPKINYATYSSRIKAFIVDLFMIYIPLLYVITYLVMGGKDEFQASNLAPFIGVALYGFISAIFVAKTAQTPGKRAYEIKIVDSLSGENLSFLRALCRFFMFLVSATTLFGLLIPLYRRDRKSLHDIICKSVVITAPKL
ncbi:MAG: RDD family protein [Sulfurimonas sp.]